LRVSSVARIYTRTGDEGETYCYSLGKRIPKDHPLMEFLGSLDEANSAVGLAASMAQGRPREDLRKIQRILFNVGFTLSGKKMVSDADVEWLEQVADYYLADFTFKGFIIPGGSTPSAATHLARSIVRRAERRLVALYRGKKLPVNDEIAKLLLRVLNRTSDALYAIAVWLDREAGTLEYV